MKYLGLHKAVWFVVVVLFTLCEMAFLIVVYVVYMLWFLRPPSRFWTMAHTSSKFDKLNGIIYADKNPIETIKRRYEFKNVSLW